VYRSSSILKVVKRGSKVSEFILDRVRMFHVGVYRMYFTYFIELMKNHG
jgi:hypothetical protein